MVATKSKSRNKPLDKSKLDKLTTLDEAFAQGVFGKDHSSNEANSNANTTASTNVATSRKSNTMADNAMPSVIEFSEDVSQQEAPVPLPVGDYAAEVRAASQKTSQNGNPYASVQFFISPDQYPADYTEGEPDGMILTYNRVSLQDTPASRHRLRKFTEAIGAPAGKKVDLNEWVGRTATVSVQHDTYEGETRAAIGKVTAA